MNSAEEAGGTAFGISGSVSAMDTAVLEQLVEILMEIGKWVERTSGTFLGHVKMAISSENGDMTINLTDLKRGADHHGAIVLPADVNIRLMAAVLDVDHDELAVTAEKALEKVNFKADKKGKIIELR
jgi:hypothetical protein